MLALSSLPLSLCLSQPALRTAPTYVRARPAVALLTELPPGFEDLMPAVVHHTPFSRHLFNAIMGYMAIDTTLFAAKIIKRRMEPGVQEANRLAAAPATNFGALPPQPYFIMCHGLEPQQSSPAPHGLIPRGSSASARHTFHHWRIHTLPTLGPHDTDTGTDSIRRAAPARHR